MDDLIERLRGYAEAEDLHVDERATLLEVADALEAAREDAERLDWLAAGACMNSGWREHGTWETPALLVNSTREHCTPADLRSAIDQARWKGGAGNGN